MEHTMTTKTTMNTKMTTLSQPRLMLHLEGAVLLSAAIVLYVNQGGALLPFLVLILAPDLAMLGYKINVRVGATIYNIAHFYALPVLLAGLGLAVANPILVQLALIWFAHISMDRMVGYGLKYPTAFKDTHMQRI
jgi:hypothetical protein